VAISYTISEDVAILGGGTRDDDGCGAPIALRRAEGFLRALSHAVRLLEGFGQDCCQRGGGPGSFRAIAAPSPAREDTPSLR